MQGLLRAYVQWLRDPDVFITPGASSSVCQCPPNLQPHDEN